MNTLELLKQRRTWASIFGFIALAMAAFKPEANIDANAITEAVMNLIQAITGFLAIVMPLLSLFMPKKNNQ